MSTNSKSGDWPLFYLQNFLPPSTPSVGGFGQSPPIISGDWPSCVLISIFLGCTDLDPEPCVEGLVDGPEHAVVALAARDELELGRDERVEADVDRVQAGRLQARQLPAQRQAVRRYSHGSGRQSEIMNPCPLYFDRIFLVDWYLSKLINYATTIIWRKAVQLIPCCPLFMSLIVP